MSAAQGLELARKWADDSATRDRQAREDAWANEQRGQDRARWEREDKARTDSMGFMEEDMKTLGTPSGVDPAFLAKHGLTPQRAQPQQTPYEARQGFGLSRSAPAPEDRVSAPEVPMAPAPMPVNPDRQRGMTMARLAQTNGDYNGYLNARKQIDTADTSGRYAQLQSAIMDAPPETIAAFSKTYSDNKTAPGKLTTGKNGLMTLTLDGGDKIQMDRTQVAQYMTGLYKMQQGDPSGMTDISGVSDKLAGAAEKMWAKMKDVSGSNNDTVLKTNQMTNDNKRTANDGARLGLARTAAGQKSAQNLREFVDEKGNTVLLDVTGIKADAQGRMPIPAGLRPKNARQELSPEDTKEYRTAVLGLGPRPAEKTGMFGGKNDSAGAAWEAQKAQIDSVFGASPGAKTNGLPAWGSGSNGASQKPGAAAAKPVSAAPSRANTQVLSQGAVEPSSFGLGRGLNTYNVQMPDGSTRLVTTDELEAMGYNLGQQDGRKAYIPGYEG